MSRSGKDVRAVPVTIFGQAYTLRTEQDPAYVQELADYLDGRMREVADRTRTADTAKIAVLAALNIADDLRRLGGEPAAATTDEAERAARIEALLDRALS